MNRRFSMWCWSGSDWLVAGVCFSGCMCIWELEWECRNYTYFIMRDT